MTSISAMEPKKTSDKLLAAMKTSPSSALQLVSATQQNKQPQQHRHRPLQQTKFDATTGDNTNSNSSPQTKGKSGEKLNGGAAATPDSSATPSAPRTAPGRDQTELVRYSPAVMTMQENTSATTNAVFLSKIQRSNEAVQRGDYRSAIQFYTEALEIDPRNYTLYSNRAAAYLNLCMYEEARADAHRSTKLQPNWTKGYLREALALERLGRISEALLTLAKGLAKQPDCTHLHDAIVRCACNEQLPLKATIEPVVGQLRGMKLDGNAFVILSVIGQSLLSGDKSIASNSATSDSQSSNPTLRSVGEILECALKIGSDNLKLLSSVYSTLSFVYWTVGELDRAIVMMRRDLKTAMQLGDPEQQCRAHGNLGAAFVAKRCYQEALASYRMRLALCMRLQQNTAAVDSLTHLSSLHKALGDYGNAVTCLKQSVVLTNQLLLSRPDQLSLRYSLSEQLASCAGLYVSLGLYPQATECVDDLAKQIDTLRRAHENSRKFVLIECEWHLHSGNLLYLQRLERQADAHLSSLLELIHSNFLDNLASEDEIARARRLAVAAYALLGAIAMSAGPDRDLKRAKKCFERQLDCALKSKSKLHEARACCNLAQLYTALGDLSAGRRLYKFSIKQAHALKDLQLLAHAFGRLGCLHRSSGEFNLAIRCFRSQLHILTRKLSRSNNLNHHLLLIAYRNLSLAYSDRLQTDSALKYLFQLLESARSYRARDFESEALYQIACCYVKRHELSKAVPYLEQDLILVRELRTVAVSIPSSVPVSSDILSASAGNYRLKESQLLNKLGYLHFQLRDFRQALVYFSADAGDGVSILPIEARARALFNMALCNKHLGDHEKAFDCLHRYLDLLDAGRLDDFTGRQRGLFEIAGLYSHRQQSDKALDTYHLVLDALRVAAAAAKPNSHAEFIAKVMNAIGEVYLKTQRFELAESRFLEALTTLDSIKPNGLELRCQVLKNLSALARQRKRPNEAMGHLQQLLEMTSRGGLPVLDLRLHALSQLAQVKIEQQNYRDAIDLLNRAAELLQVVYRPPSTYTAVGSATNDNVNVNADSRCGVGSDLPLSMSELAGERVEVYQLLGDAYAKLIFAETERGEAAGTNRNGDAGPSQADVDAKTLSQLSAQNYERACQLAEEVEDLKKQYEAYRGLATLHGRLENVQLAIVYYEKCLLMAHELQQTSIKTVTYGELGRLHTLQQNFDQAITCLQHQLAIARETSDLHVEVAAASSLGRVYSIMNERSRALEFHRLELRIAESLKDPLLLQRAFCNCGLAFEASSNYASALRCQQSHLQIAEVTGDAHAKLLAFASLGRLLHQVAHYREAVQYLLAALQLAEQRELREQQAKLHYRIAVSSSASGNTDLARNHHHLAIEIFEQLVAKTCCQQPATDIRECSKSTWQPEVDPASARDLQAASYEQLQRLLLDEQRVNEALSISERAKCVECFEFFLQPIDGMTDRPFNSASDSSNNTGPKSIVSNSSGDFSSVTASFVQRPLSFSPAPNQQLHAQPSDTCSVSGSDVHSLPAFDYQPLSSDQMLQFARLRRVHFLHFSFVQQSLCVWLLSAASHQPRFHQVVFSRDELSSLVRTVRGAFGVDSYSSSDRGETKSMLEFDLEELINHQASDLTCADSAALFETEADAGRRQSESRLSSSAALKRSVSAQSLSDQLAFNAVPPPTLDKKRGGRTGRKLMKLRSADPADDRKCVEAVERLYAMLLAHFEAEFRKIEAAEPESPDGKPSLVIIGDASLLQVPFAMLSSHASGCRRLGERFSLLHAPCISLMFRLHLVSKLNAKQRRSEQKQSRIQYDTLVLGAPQFNKSLDQRWNLFKLLRSSEGECMLTAKLLNARAVLHGDASKQNLFNRLQSGRSQWMELVHFSLPVCFRLGALLCSGSAVTENENENNVLSLTDCVVRVDDLKQLGLRTRVLVLTLTDTQDRLEAANVAGYQRLLNALLSAGAECIIAQTWRSPNQQAHAMLLEALFSFLLQGVPACEALSNAQAQLRADPKFRHARHWSGWFCIGEARTALSNQLHHVYDTVADLIRCVPYKEMRDAVRISLHLVEKSLARTEHEIDAHHSSPMFVSLANLETRIGHSRIWPEVLRSIGFRFEQLEDPGRQAGAEDSVQKQVYVYFPQTNMCNRLRRSSALFHAVLNLPQNALVALSKLLISRGSPAIGDSMMALVTKAMAQLSGSASPVISLGSHQNGSSPSPAPSLAAELKVSSQLWRTAGCHEFLASIGFDLVGISNNGQVTIKSSKQMRLRNLQLATTLVDALFKRSSANSQVKNRLDHSRDSLLDAPADAAVVTQGRPGSTKLEVPQFHAISASRQRGTSIADANVAVVAPFENHEIQRNGSTAISYVSGAEFLRVPQQVQIQKFVVNNREMFGSQRIVAHYHQPAVAANPSEDNTTRSGFQSSVAAASALPQKPIVIDV